MFARTLVALAVVFALSASPAFAGTLDVTPEIHGAGAIENAPGSTSVIPCSQDGAVTATTVKTCPRWVVDAGADVPAVVINAVAAPGWELQGWTGCSTAALTYCLVSGPADQALTLKPVATFVDYKAPDPVNLRATPANGGEGSYAFTWDDSEPGVTYRCAFDGGAPFACASGRVLQLTEGRHTLGVSGEDPSGNVGPFRELWVIVVDTELTAGPAEGATVQTAAFSARTGFGNAFQCSLDGGPWLDCRPVAPGAGAPGLTAQLTVGGLTEGRHTLRVRGKFGDAVDLYPAERTFTIDTTAPATTIRAVAGVLALGSDEPGATFHCRLDGGAWRSCPETYPTAGLAPGPHTIEAYATDAAGNVDPTPATLEWTVTAPPSGGEPGGGGAPGGGNGGAGGAPSGDTGATGGAAPSGTPASTRAAKLAVRYRYARGRLTRLRVTGVPAGTKLTVTVKRPHHRARRTTVRKLVGAKLPRGTKITVRAGKAARTITLRRTAARGR